MQTCATLFVFIAVTATVSSECIWYKTCYKNEMGMSFNCPYNGPGFPLNDEKAQEILLRRCSHFYNDSK